tara:strand:- start:364 stop:627 length:264 start_codon:yes stop_codon:yes gene_type:complete
MARRRNIHIKKAIGKVLQEKKEPLSIRQIADILSNDNPRYYNFNTKKMGQVLVGAKGIKIIRKTSLKGKLYEMIDKRIYDRWILGED